MEASESGRGGSYRGNSLGSIWGREVGGRSSSPHRGPYGRCGSRDARDGERIRWTGLARVCGDLRLSDDRQAGSGMARSRAKARLNFSAQGQRSGRCRVNRRAERVSRPAREKNRRRRVLVVAIRSPRHPRRPAGQVVIVWTASRRRWRRSGPRGDGSARRRT